MRFQRLYSPDPGGNAPPGQKPPRQAPPAPSPGREPRQRRPPTLPPWWGLKQAKELLPLAIAPYYRLSQIDPNETVAYSKYLDTVLEPYNPARLVSWYKTETVPAQPGGYMPADEPAGIFFWCLIADGPYEAVAWSPTFSGAPCTFATIRVPTADYGVTIPAGVQEVIFGEYNPLHSRMSQLKSYGFHAPSPVPWVYTPGSPAYSKSIPIWGDPLAHTALQVLPLGFAETDNDQKMDPLPRVPRLSRAVGRHFVPAYVTPVKEIVIKSDSGGGGSATSGPGHHVEEPPGPGKKEKKFDIKGAPGSTLRKLGDAGGKLSEIGDAADAISDAIATGYSPRAMRNVKNPCKGLPLHEKLACIAMNAQNVDWQDAVINLATNEVGDRAIGKIVGKTNSNFKKSGYGDGRGYGLSRYAQLKWKGK